MLINSHFSGTLFLAASLAFVAPWFALADDKTAPPYVRVNGEATIAVQPDRAELDLGIISQAASSRAVTDLNAKQSSAVIDGLHSVLPASAIKVVSFSVNPNYRFAKEGGTPEILGYTANNTIRLTIDDLASVQQVIQLATKAGASNVNRLNFLLRDEAKARASALGEAATQARGGAEALALSLKLKLGRVLSVEEGQPVIVSSTRQAEVATVKTAGVALEIGSIQIHASVALTFELIQ